LEKKSENPRGGIFDSHCSVVTFTVLFARAGIDAEFEKLLGEIFGVDLIETFKSKRPAGWVDLMIAFESRKRAANPHKTSALNVSLPFSFIDFHKKHLVRAALRYGDLDL